MMTKKIRTVLIAEDDPAIRECLGMFFDFLSLKYFIAENGLEAIKIFKTEKIDLLLTDFQMPEMDGLDLLKWCRESGIHIPVIFVSAKAESIEPFEIELDDCCAWLMQKPFNLNRLSEALQAAESRVHHISCVHHRH